VAATVGFAAAISLVASQLIVPRPPGLEAYVGDLWQIQAAILGFAVALAVYAMGMLGRLTGMAQSINAVATYPAAINVGLGVIIATGIARLPQLAWLSPWLDPTVILMSFAWITMVAAALSRTIELHNPLKRIELRREMVLNVALRTLERQAFMVFGMRWLERELAAAEIGFSALGADAVPAENSRVVRLGRRGLLHDINVNRLLWALRFASSRGCKTEFTARPGQILSPATPVLLSDVPLPPATRMVLTRSIRLRPPDSEESLDVEIDRLRMEAKEAIGSTSGETESVLRIYTEVIIEWGKYQRAFETSPVA
jgi:hypothetical protein